MPSTRPNVIIVTTDQQRTDSLSCYGSTFTHSPCIDRLGAEGVVCDRAYCANPVCTPARASIFSGLYLTRHAAWNVGTAVPDGVPLLSHMLGTAGYQTHYVGKAHFQPFGGEGRSVEDCDAWQRTYAAWHGPYYGFDTVELSLGHTSYGLRGHYGLWLRSLLAPGDIEAMNATARVVDGPAYGGEAYDWTLPARLHSSVWTTDRAIDFIEHRDPSRPFLLAVGFQDPHHPHCVPRDFDARVDPDAVGSPRYVPGELEDKPPHFMIAHTGELEASRFRGHYWVAGQGPGASFAGVPEQDARTGRAYYHTMVRLIDREIGRLLDFLDKHDLAENTLIVFTTDHGELLGDHGLWMKGPFHYEELVRIPMVVRWPAGIPASRHAAGLISQVDIVPTVLAAVGAAAPAPLDGVDALPLLRSEVGSVRDAAVVECVDDPRGLRLKTVVTADWKLTAYHGERFGELYDLRAGPGEVTNLWDSAAHAARKAELLGRLFDHAERLEPRAERYAYA